MESSETLAAPFFSGTILCCRKDIFVDKPTYTLSVLSSKFYADYPMALYPEIMQKENRPYVCLNITVNDYTMCIPFRSFIPKGNAYCFAFKKSGRSTQGKSGLDYSKIVLVTNKEYIDSSAVAIVDKDELNEVAENINKIAADVLEYVETYINHVNNSKPLHIREYERRYRFSTLTYFHDILFLDESQDKPSKVLV